jgi:NAD(P)-dependent dehydrogenase (short-subunit alcohol dehydrogenase family)
MTAELLALDFSRQHVVVFGGTTGINFGIAQAFARSGAAVTVASRKQGNVDGALEVLRTLTSRALGLVADVTDFDGVGRAFEQAADRFGPVDTLVSGAAGNFLCEAQHMSSNGFRKVVDIDLNGSFHVMRQGWAHLRKPGASVINITAPQGSVPMRYQVHCAAAKAGVDQLTRVLALEWGAEGVRVNAISPGPIGETEGVKRLMARNDEERQAAVQRVPLLRLGSVTDIANLALFLASPHAGYVSGAVIPCDGGGAFDSVKPTLEAAGRALRSPP